MKTSVKLWITKFGFTTFHADAMKEASHAIACGMNADQAIDRDGNTAMKYQSFQRPILLKRIISKRIAVPIATAMPMKTKEYVGSSTSGRSIPTPKIDGSSLYTLVPVSSDAFTST